MGASPVCSVAGWLWVLKGDKACPEGESPDSGSSQLLALGGACSGTPLAGSLVSMVSGWEDWEFDSDARRSKSRLEDPVSSGHTELAGRCSSWDKLCWCHLQAAVTILHQRCRRLSSFCFCGQIIQETLRCLLGGRGQGPTSSASLLLPRLNPVGRAHLAVQIVQPRGSQWILPCALLSLLLRPAHFRWRLCICLLPLLEGRSIRQGASPATVRPQESPGAGGRGLLLV